MTASNANLLFSTDIPAFQIIQTGRLAIPGSFEVTITVPNVGYQPMVMFFPKVTGFAATFGATMWVQYLSSTSIKIHCETTISNDGTVTYAVLRTRVG